MALTGEGLAVEYYDRAAVVRFTRTEIRSPLSVVVLNGLNKVLDGLWSGDVDKLIFTGVGDVFASGADLREVAAVDSDGARAFAVRGQALMTRIAGLRQRTIAAVNGFCFGGALDLALACNVRVASSNATFAHPGAGLGIITGWGGTQRLAALVGQGNALELFFTARAIDAERAFAIGLVDEIAADPVERALELPV